MPTKIRKLTYVYALHVPLPTENWLGGGSFLDFRVSVHMASDTSNMVEISMLDVIFFLFQRLFKLIKILILCWRGSFDKQFLALTSSSNFRTKNCICPLVRYLCQLSDFQC